MIRWLGLARCRILSDKSPLEPFPDRLGSTLAAQNILNNQFRILPSLDNPSDASDCTAIDKVIVCGSTVLQHYVEDRSAVRYVERIETAYKSSGGETNQIRDTVESSAQDDGFHHVLTEIAFLNIRRLHNRGDHGIIPLALSGDLPGTYLPGCIENCDVVLKLGQGNILIEQHRLFFQLLSKVYPHIHSEIEEFKRCYNKTSTQLGEEGATTTAKARSIILGQVHGASKDLLNQISNAIRVARGEEMRLQNQEDREVKCLQLLHDMAPLPYSDRKDRNPVREKGTCEWVTSHPRFRSWQASTAPGLLWVSADPGCGKSVLSRYLIDEVLPNSATSTTCYFFFKDDFDDQRNFVNALRCILHQLFSQKRSLLREALDRFLRDGQTLSSPTALWNILVHAANHNDAGEVICIIDALDECKEADRRIMGSFLTELYVHPDSETSRLKFLITSRPYHDIERDFRLLEEQRPTIRLAGENEAEVQKIAREIYIVIQARAKQLKRTLPLEDGDYHTLLDGMTRLQNRTYLWATLVFEVIEKAVETTGSELAAILHELPQDVDEAYEKILSRNQGRAIIKARKILQIIVAAERPLSLDEMSTALAVEEHLERGGGVQPESVEKFYRTIRHLCGLFVIINDSKIYLLHQTAREFLVKKPATRPAEHTSSPRPFLWLHSLNLARKLPVKMLATTAAEQTSLPSPFHWRHSLDVSTCNCFLARLCIESLLLGFKNEYAAENWMLHLRAAGKVDGVQSLLPQAQKLCYNHVQDPPDILQSAYINYCGEIDEYPQGMTALVVASTYGLTDVVHLLLKEVATDKLATTTNPKMTALAWACEYGHANVVKAHLSAMSWRKTRRALRHQGLDFDSPLVIAADCGHSEIVRLLLGAGAPINDAMVSNRQTALHLAAVHGHKDVAQVLLETGANPNARSKVGYTPLHFAAGMGCEAIVRILLASRAQPDVQTEDGITPLCLAATGGYKRVVQTLLELGAQLNAPTEVGDTPLHLVAKMGHEEAVQMLLELGAQLDARNRMGETPLHLAATMGHDTVVGILIEWNAELNARTHNQLVTPLDRAIMHNHKAVAWLLRKSGAQAKVQNHH